MYRSMSWDIVWNYYVLKPSMDWFKKHLSDPSSPTDVFGGSKSVPFIQLVEKTYRGKVSKKTIRYNQRWPAGKSHGNPLWIEVSSWENHRTEWWIFQPATFEQTGRLCKNERDSPSKALLKELAWADQSWINPWVTVPILDNPLGWE